MSFFSFYILPVQGSIFSKCKHTNMFNNNVKCPDESLKRPSGCKVAETCFSKKKKKKDIENTDSHRLRMVPRIPQNSKHTGRQTKLGTHVLNDQSISRLYRLSVPNNYCFLHQDISAIGSCFILQKYNILKIWEASVQMI